MPIHLTTMPMQDVLEAKSGTTSSSSTNFDNTSSCDDNAVAIWFDTLLRAEAMQGAASRATLLAWVMGLPDNLDPSQAAASLLAYQRDHVGRRLSEPLTALLQDVAIYPARRLERLRSGRRHAVTARIN